MIMEAAHTEEKSHNEKVVGVDKLVALRNNKYFIKMSTKER